MTGLTCGMLTGMIGSAIGFWIWSRRCHVAETAFQRHGHLPEHPDRERGSSEMVAMTVPAEVHPMHARRLLAPPSS